MQITTEINSNTTLNANNGEIAMQIATQNTSPAICVGSADKVHAAPIAVTPTCDDVRSRVDALIAERRAWEFGAYVTSNKQLYAILQKCYQLYFDLRGMDKEVKAARATLNDLMEQKGNKCNQGTHMLTKIAKFVFDGFDRRRVSAYGLVLRAALEGDTLPADIPAFITNGGGVEQIRRSKSKTALTAKQKAALGKTAVEEKQLAVIDSATLAATASNASAGDDLVAIVTMQADGSFVVRQLITNKSVVNAALVCAYSASKVVGKTDKQSMQAANDDKAIDDLINEAAA